MCGILVHKGNGNKEFISRRGIFPTSEKIEGLTFEHFLLPINGYNEQPFIKDGIVCIYNGEIYNHEFKESDGENIIPLYQKYGIRFPEHLDGEFAIALYDFSQNVALFVTDRFRTKPLWRNGIECASYESGVGGHSVPPNTVEMVNIETEEIIFTGQYHQWDFTQYKTNYEDWIKAFEEAVSKRATDRCFIGLSSGYDSGAISWALTRTGKNFKAFSILNNENEEIIKERAKYCYEYEEITVQPKKTLDIEPVKYHKAKESLVRDDIASIGLATICERAKREGRKVCLSGQGADEIIGDYALYPKQSAFKGVFPKELKEWENFTGGLQQDYLTKEEYVGGAFAIETRYPFLDTRVVQEFLWLTPELKNRCYKAPIDEYLTRNKVPYDKGVKRGFRPI